MTSDAPISLEDTPNLLDDRLTAEIPRLMEQAHVPGLSIALVRDAAIAWQHGFGLKRANTPEPVEPDTVFQAASLSKPVFAYAVLKLAERGRLALDTPLTLYPPDRYAPDDPLLDQITARHVLSHTTGWPNWRPEGQPLRRERAPGKGFGYSGEGYNYLQRVVEQLVGRPLDAYMKDALLDPLGMTHSSYAWATPDNLGMAMGHDRAGNTADPFTGARLEAASSLHTTPHDLARFLVALMSPGDEPWRLRPEGLAEMLRARIHLTPAVFWGLGWGLEDTGDGRMIWHWGDNPGYKCFVLASLEAQTGVVIMANGDGGIKLWEPIVHLVLGGDHPAFAWLASFYGVATLADALK